VLIVSKFRDYYDASVGYGVDKTIVYERETRVVRSNEFFVGHHIDSDNYYLKRPNLNEERFDNQWKIIGFCGKTYVAVIQTKKDSNGQQQIIDCYYGQEILEKVYGTTRPKKGRILSINGMIKFLQIFLSTIIRRFFMFNPYRIIKQDTLMSLLTPL
jgi:hypothetical protein